MLPHALAVMRQFRFPRSSLESLYGAASRFLGRIYHPRTALRPGVPPEQAVLIASDLLHEDYAYMFEAYWDLWMLAENGEWTLNLRK